MHYQYFLFDNHNVKCRFDQCTSVSHLHLELHSLIFNHYDSDLPYLCTWTYGAKATSFCSNQVGSILWTCSLIGNLRDVTMSKNFLSIRLPDNYISDWSDRGSRGVFPIRTSLCMLGCFLPPPPLFLVRLDLLNLQFCRIKIWTPIFIGFYRILIFLSPLFKFNFDFLVLFLPLHQNFLPRPRQQKVVLGI